MGQLCYCFQCVRVFSMFHNIYVLFHYRNSYSESLFCVQTYLVTATTHFTSNFPFLNFYIYLLVDLISSSTRFFLGRLTDITFPGMFLDCKCRALSYIRGYFVSEFHFLTLRTLHTWPHGLLSPSIIPCLSPLILCLHSGWLLFVLKNFFKNHL